MLAELTTWGWVLLAFAALLAGFSKTAIGGVAMVSVVIAALVLPTRDSTGVMLLIFLTGDLVAIWTYRHSVDWRLLAKLVVPLLLGIGLGAVFLSRVDDLVLKRTIGVVLLGLLLLGLRGERSNPHRAGVRWGYGGLAGFTTMVANAGGPAMNLYLLSARYPKLQFLGTTAWFFFGVNLTKLPISISLGLVWSQTALIALILAPIVLGGTWVGRLLIGRIQQATFEKLVTGFVALSAVMLLVT